MFNRTILATLLLILALSGNTVADYQRTVEPTVEEFVFIEDETERRLLFELKRKAWIEVDESQPEEAVDQPEEAVEESQDLSEYIAIVEQIRAKANVGDGYTAEEIVHAIKLAYDEFGLEERGMTFEDWLAQVKVESNFNAHIIGTSQDTGLTQVIPSTAFWLNAKFFQIPDFSMDMLLDPYLSARFGAKYMQIMLDSYGSVEVAQECYNKGPKGVHFSDYRERVVAVSRQYFRR